MSWKRRVSGLFVTSCVLLGGCSGSGRPEMYPVQGKVTYKGEAVSGAAVAFLCTGAPRMAVGTTDASGTYALTTYEPNDGAMIGTHTVTIRKVGGNSEIAEDVPSGPMDSKALNKAIEQSMRQSVQQARKAEKSGSGLPLKYARMSTTDVQKEVVEGPNVIDIELTD